MRHTYTDHPHPPRAYRAAYYLEPGDQFQVIGWRHDMWWTCTAVLHDVRRCRLQVATREGESFDFRPSDMVRVPVEVAA
jgi:hypothetical protein